ncbi:MAG TPA: YciI family protein [Casimicrobiaceae bacterium]|nr:YciI family protein [Casimicrobiaceae bacterium]
MKFVCLICAEKVMEQMEPEAASRHYADYVKFTEGISKSGNYVGGNRLLPAATAATVRVRDGKVSVTDGPFAETKEQLGGYYVIDAADRDEAIRIAAKIPGASVGCVEVRAIADDPRTIEVLDFATNAAAR